MKHGNVILAVEIALLIVAAVVATRCYRKAEWPREKRTAIEQR